MAKSSRLYVARKDLFTKEEIAAAVEEAEEYLYTVYYPNEDKIPKKAKESEGFNNLYDAEDIACLGLEFIKWCETADVPHVTGWAIYKKKTYEWWRHLLSGYPALRLFHNRGKEILGSRLYDKVVQSKNEWLMRAYLPKYLSEAKETLNSQADTIWKEQKRRLDYEHRQKLDELKQKADLAMARLDDAGVKVDRLTEILDVLDEVKKHSDDYDSSD